jgi:hypothetical protein
MLLQSHEHVIKLFPVWPNDRNARFTSLRAVGAFLVSSELKDRNITYIHIKSEKGRICSILNPWSTEDLWIMEINGEQQREIEWQLSGNVISFATEAGKHYRLSSQHAD